jgi:hypothetical protein
MRSAAKASNATASAIRPVRRAMRLDRRRVRGD